MESDMKMIGERQSVSSECLDDVRLVRDHGDTAQLHPENPRNPTPQRFSFTSDHLSNEKPGV
jgi:hypothetical protein